MKSGRTLTDLAAELQRQNDSKKDYLAPNGKLHMQVSEGASPLENVVITGVNGGMQLTPIAHGQLAGVLGIPKQYYDKMLADKPDLLATNVNRWLQNEPSARRMLRTLDGKVRAVLSDGYRPLDNYDLVRAVLPKLNEMKARVESCEVTDRRFYLKAITNRIQGEVKKGDLVQAGVVIGNSEVGQGAIKIEALDYRLVCTNGMISATAIRKAHLGRGARGQDLIEDAREYFRTETRILDDQAFWAKVTDAVGAMFNQQRFDLRLNKYRAAAGEPILLAPENIVEVTAAKYGLNESERAGVFANYIRENDMTRWGFANAITRTANDIKDYDRATELESLGGEIVELSRAEWDKLAKVT